MMILVVSSGCSKARFGEDLNRNEINGFDEGTGTLEFSSRLRQYNL
jgi:hypothetical protein